VNIAGIRDIDFSLSKVGEPVSHAQAILRRLSTDRGGLIGSPNYGYNLLNAVGSTVVAYAVEQRVREQCLADERTADASVTVSFSESTEVLSVKIDVVRVDDDTEFTLVISAQEQLTAQLIIDGNPPFWIEA